MIRFFISKYRTCRDAVSQRSKVTQKGTLLNAFNETKTIFVHIPKTAGISLLSAIYGNVSLESHRSIFFNQTALNIKSNDFFSFTFVRNPFDRLYSTYKFLENGGINKQDEIAFQTHFAKFTSFEDFVMNGLNKSMIYQVTHLIPQYEYLCDWNGKVIVDFVGRFESLVKDVKRLSEHLTKEIKLNNLNKTSKVDYTEVYTDEMIKKVKNIYKKDLRIFNYSF
tara:strand:+ start:382 stop:1050 length:669 start_codon:yes stop_codon:yes gene_type:complete